jgi:nicotinamide-nucleotide amidase
MKTKENGVFLLAIGDEILDGRTQNTHATWFAEQLRLAGIPVAESRAVSDRLPAIASTLRDAARFPLVIVTGGLGPTNDDRTLEGAAKAFGLPLLESKAALRHLQKAYSARSLELTPTRRKMALAPKGARVLNNDNGTAPGLHLVHKGCDFFFLPGPPNECRPVFLKDVLPAAARRVRSRRLLQRDFWRTFGRGESAVYQQIQPLVETLEKRYPETLNVGVHIVFPYIDITIEAWKVPGRKSPPRTELERAADQISRALGSLCFSRSRESLAETVAALLRERKLTVATAESCTGGLLGKLLTDIPGSSTYYLGGVITYANSAKGLLAGVNKKSLSRHGAVSDLVVSEMAEGVRQRLGANYALALSGVAGPGGGSAEKPVGTIYVALSSGERTRTVRQVILGGKGSRDQNRIIAAHLALDALRSEILGFVENGIPVN